jgi:hypothetical protein
LLTGRVLSIARAKSIRFARDTHSQSVERHAPGAIALYRRDFFARRFAVAFVAVLLDFYEVDFFAVFFTDFPADFLAAFVTARLLDFFADRFGARFLFARVSTTGGAASSGSETRPSAASGM